MIEAAGDHSHDDFTWAGCGVGHVAEGELTRGAVGEQLKRFHDRDVKWMSVRLCGTLVQNRSAFVPIFNRMERTRPSFKVRAVSFQLGFNAAIWPGARVGSTIG
jgi:hypothetical protein